MTKPCTAICLIVLCLGAFSCKHEVPLPESSAADRQKAWSIDTIIDRGEILDLGVSNSVVCMKNSKPEIGVYDRASEQWMFFNEFNSPLEDVVQIRSVSPSLLLLSDTDVGLVSINHSGIVVHDSSTEYMGFNYDGDTSWATIFGVFVRHQSRTYKLANGFRFGFNHLTDLAAIGTTCWVGTQSGGVYEIDMPSKGIKLIASENLPSAIIKQMIVDDENRLWVVTRRGVSTYYRNSWKSFNKTNGLIINHIALVDNHVHVASESGMYLFDRNSGKYTENSGINELLPNKHCNVVESDSSGALWVGTENGLFRFAPAVR